MCESLEAQVNTHQLERAELDAALADAQAGLTESNVGRSAAEEATAKATEQLAAAAATVAALEGKFKESSAKLGREMKDKIFMHTRHKEEVAKLRRASKAGEYEKRYASLVLENRTLRRFRDAIQGLWKAEKPASSQAVGDEKESKGGDDSEAPKADESTEGGAAGASDTAVGGAAVPGLFSSVSLFRGKVEELSAILADSATMGRLLLPSTNPAAAVDTEVVDVAAAGTVVGAVAADEVVNAAADGATAEGATDMAIPSQEGEGKTEGEEASTTISAADAEDLQFKLDTARSEHAADLGHWAVRIEKLRAALEVAAADKAECLEFVEEERKALTEQVVRLEQELQEAKAGADAAALKAAEATANATANASAAADKEAEAEKEEVDDKEGAIMKQAAMEEATAAAAAALADQLTKVEELTLALGEKEAELDAVRDDAQEAEEKACTSVAECERLQSENEEALKCADAATELVDALGKETQAAKEEAANTQRRCQEAVDALETARLEMNGIRLQAAEVEHGSMGGAVERDGECEKWRKEAAIAQEECDRLKKACGAKEQESAAASEEHAQESEMLKEQASTRLEQVSAMLVQCTQLEKEVAEKTQEAAETALRSAEQEARVKEAEALTTEVESAVAAAVEEKDRLAGELEEKEKEAARASDDRDQFETEAGVLRATVAKTEEELRESRGEAEEHFKRAAATKQAAEELRRDCDETAGRLAAATQQIEALQLAAAAASSASTGAETVGSVGGGETAAEMAKMRTEVRRLEQLNEEANAGKERAWGESLARVKEHQRLCKQRLAMEGKKH